MIELILLLPVALSAILLIFRLRALNIAANVLYAVVFFTVSVMLKFNPAGFTSFFKLDDLNIVFLLILAVVNLCVAVYNIQFLRRSGVPVTSQTLYAANLLVFIASMSGVILSTHLGMLWVFVEATTLTSSYLIFFSHSDASLEATWKYLFICSIGIAIAFVGIIFLSMGLGRADSLYFRDLYKNARQINPFWLKLSFPFILAGFGTKVGFAPMHSWLPDAHSESPSPISALLSGTLLNAALLGIMRVNKIMSLAGMQWYSDNLLLFIGFISIFISAVYIVSIKNYKRMLAYSSIENMGIISICLGVSGAGLYAAILHAAAHSFTKSAFFLTSGNILHKYKSKEIKDIRGILKSDTATGWLWILCFTGIVGIPPFPIFISEFLAVRAMIDAGMIALLVLFLLLLTINMAGIGRAVLRMCFGPGEKEPSAGPLSYAPQFVLVSLLIAMCVWMPPQIEELIKKAAAFL